MRYSSAVLFAALMAWGTMSPVFACRSEKNATIVKVSSDRYARTGIDQYSVKVDPGSFVLSDIESGPTHDSGFCVSLSILDSSDLQNTTTGVMFWSVANDSARAYFLQIRNDEYRIFSSAVRQTIRTRSLDDGCVNQERPSRKERS